MTSLLPTERFVGAKTLCSEQTMLDDPRRHRQQRTLEFEQLLRGSVPVLFSSFLVALVLACVLTPRSYAQTRGGTPNGAGVQSAATTFSTDDVASTASGTAENDKTKSETPGPSSNVADPEIPPAVQKQLQLMQLRISQLEQQLGEKGKPVATPTMATGTGTSGQSPDECIYGVDLRNCFRTAAERFSGLDKT